MAIRPGIRPGAQRMPASSWQESKQARQSEGGGEVAPSSLALAKIIRRRGKLGLRSDLTASEQEIDKRRASSLLQHTGLSMSQPEIGLSSDQENPRNQQKMTAGCQTSGCVCVCVCVRNLRDFRQGSNYKTKREGLPHQLHVPCTGRVTRDIAAGASASWELGTSGNRWHSTCGMGRNEAAAFAQCQGMLSHEPEAPKE